MVELTSSGFAWSPNAARPGVQDEIFDMPALSVSTAFFRRSCSGSGNAFATNIARWLRASASFVVSQ